MKQKNQERLMDYELANSLWEYRDGHLYWKIKAGRGQAVKHPGDNVGGSEGRYGYVYASWKRKKYAAHRIIFLLAHKYLPIAIDHKDGNPRNNTVENLRAATLSQNQYNRCVNRNSKTGLKNVCFHMQNRNWVVRLWKGKKHIFFGSYSTVEEAQKIAVKARETLYGEFARHA